MVPYFEFAGFDGGLGSGRGGRAGRSQLSLAELLFSSDCAISSPPKNLPSTRRAFLFSVAVIYHETFDEILFPQLGQNCTGGS